MKNLAFLAFTLVISCNESFIEKKELIKNSSSSSEVDLPITPLVEDFIWRKENQLRVLIEPLKNKANQIYLAPFSSLILDYKGILVENLKLFYFIESLLNQEAKINFFQEISDLYCSCLECEVPSKAENYPLKMKSLFILIYQELKYLDYLKKEHINEYEESLEITLKNFEDINESLEKLFKKEKDHHAILTHIRKIKEFFNSNFHKISPGFPYKEKKTSLFEESGNLFNSMEEEINKLKTKFYIFPYLEDLAFLYHKIQNLKAPFEIGDFNSILEMLDYLVEKLEGQENLTIYLEILGFLKTIKKEFENFVSLFSFT